MKKKIVYKNIDITPPYNLNILIAIVSMSSYVALLYGVNAINSWPIKILLAVLFAHVANTVFSLLHEAVHNGFHSNKNTNYFFGVILSAFFPTAYSFQKRCHLNHHKNNRTKLESFELYDQHDSYFLRSFSLYSVLTGFYYTFPFLGCLFLLISPSKMIHSAFNDKVNSYKVARMGGASMLRNFENLSIKEITRMRLEVLATIIIYFSIIYFLNISLVTWLLCFGAFALMWSTLQYVDHAYSPRDIKNGAWNVSINPITRIFFLNYHYHQAHHQHPNVSWLHLSKFQDPKYDSPSFWKIYFRMWKGLEKTDVIEPIPLDPEFEKLIEEENFA